jgi:hypothetical protein
MIHCFPCPVSASAYTTALCCLLNLIETVLSWSAGSFGWLGKLWVVLTNTFTLSFWSCQDQWPYFVLSKTSKYFEIGPPIILYCIVFFQIPSVPYKGMRRSHTRGYRKHHFSLQNVSFTKEQVNGHSLYIQTYLYTYR